MDQTDEDIRFQDVMRNMKKFTSREISSKLKNEGQKLFLHVFMKATEREEGKRDYKIWQMNIIIHKSFIQMESAGNEHPIQ